MKILVCILAGLFLYITAQPVEDDLDSKIIGGRPAPEGLAPFMVSLQVQDNPTSFRKFCGGTILKPNWILTAGHCVLLYTDNRSDGLYVRAGVINAVDHTNPKGQFIQVNNTYIHPNYKGNVNPHDLALLELKEPLKLNQYVQTMALPPAGYVPEGYGWLFGWGAIGNPEHLNPTDVLMHVRVPITPLSECRKTLPQVTENHFCPGTAGMTQCGGDSGGPFVQQIDKHWAVIGVSSFSKRPCGYQAGAYVLTSAYLDDFILPGLEGKLKGTYIGNHEGDKPPVWN